MKRRRNTSDKSYISYLVRRPNALDLSQDHILVSESATLVSTSAKTQRTFQGRVKQKTANAHEEISEECHHENGVVAMFPATDNAGVGKVCERQVGQGVDDLGSVRSSVVVLEDISIAPAF